MSISFGHFVDEDSVQIPLEKLCQDKITNSKLLPCELTMMQIQHQTLDTGCMSAHMRPDTHTQV